MQELDPAPTGPVHNIFAGSELGMVEGSLLYKRNGTYYLLTAEGGTGAGNNYTGAFVGMAAQDLAGTARPADSSEFDYRESS